MLDTAFDHGLLVAERADHAMLMMDRVPLAVLALEQHGAPGEPERHPGGRVAAPRALDVVRRDADILAHAPGMITRREPHVGRDRRARTVELDPSGGHTDLVIAQHVHIDA